MKKTFGKQAMRVMAAALVMVLLMVSMASGEQSAWDCPECGRTGNLWNYCGNCAHPAPWTKEEGFDEEKAYDAVLKQLEEIEGKIGSVPSGKTVEEQISVLETGKAMKVELGAMPASSDADAIGKAWDAISSYYQPVFGQYQYKGQWMFMAFKYSDSQYGMMIAMHYGGTVLKMHIIDGEKSVKTIQSN